MALRSTHVTLTLEVIGSAGPAKTDAEAQA